MPDRDKRMIAAGRGIIGVVLLAGFGFAAMAEDNTPAQEAAVNVAGTRISLSDVERLCSVYIITDNFGELRCKEPVDILSRLCEVSITDWPDGILACRSTELRPLEERCVARMSSEQTGEVSCRD